MRSAQAWSDAVCSFCRLLRQLPGLCAMCVSILHSITYHAELRSLNLMFAAQK